MLIIDSTTLSFIKAYSSGTISSLIKHIYGVPTIAVMEGGVVEGSADNRNTK